MFRSAALVLDRMPVGMRHFVAGAGALLGYISSPRKRRNVRRNLEGVGAAADASAVFGVFKHHATNMVEIFASSRWDADEIRSRIQGAELDIIDRALAAERGVILVTVHAGNWELAALFLSLAGHRMHVVAGVQMNRLLTNAVKDAKHRFGIEVINPENSYRRLFTALESNGVVALLLDGDVYSGGSPVDLFGRKIIMPRGAVQLSERTGAPILGGYCRRLGRDEYRIHLEKILDPAIDGHRSEEESMRLLYDRIEEFIARNSDQWCMFRDFWGDSR